MSSLHHYDSLGDFLKSVFGSESSIELQGKVTGVAGLSGVSSQPEGADIVTKPGEKLSKT